MAAAPKDQFSNIATITVTESAGNTLTYKKLETGISLSEKVAWLISRIEYMYTGYPADDFNGGQDELHLGLSVSNSRASQVTADAYCDPTLLDKYMINLGLRTAIGWAWIERPFVKDFANLPGGGILVPPVPLYGWAQGVGLVNATTTVIKLFYSLLQLSTDQYWELVEARRVISS